MARWILVLITLVAQAVAMPTCFVRCVGADGHVCIELAGQDCHCCDSEPACDGHVHDVCNYVANVDDDAPSELQNIESSAIRLTRDGCGCRHAVLESAPSVATKASSPTVRARWTSGFASPLAGCFLANVVTAESLRTDSAPPPPLHAHLVALATVVLRV